MNKQIKTTVLQILFLIFSVFIQQGFLRTINTISSDFSGASLDSIIYECKFSDNDQNLFLSSSNDKAHNFQISSVSNVQNFNDQHGGNNVDTIENIDKYDIVFTSSKTAGGNTNIWQISSGSKLSTLNYDSQYIKKSKDQEMVCIPDYNSSNVYIINTNDQSEKQIITAVSNIKSCEFINNDTQILVSAGAQGKIYNLSDSLLDSTITFGGNVNVVQQNPNFTDQFLGVQSSGVIEIRDIDSNLKVSQTIGDSVRSGQYSQNGQWVFISGIGASLNSGYILCSQTLQTYYTINAGNKIHYGQFTNDGLKVCLSGEGNYISIYEAVCVTNEYANGSNVCTSCVFPCNECKSETYCISCQDPTYREIPGCGCIDGYYEILNICEKCDVNCLTCETQSNNCTACKDQSINSDNSSSCGCINNHFLNLNGYCEICENGKYQSNQICVDCDPKCTTCQGSSTNCLTCSDSNTKGGPLCECKVGYFQSQETNICEKCQYPCLACNSLTDCISCAGTGIEYQTAPTCTCNIGYYKQPDKNRCIACQDKCLQCDQDSVLGNYCLGNQCKDPTLLFPNCENVFTGLFSVLVNGRYQEYLCTPRCENCIDQEDKCLSCKGNFRRQELPLCECIEGYYDEDGQLEDCKEIQCDSRCFKCDIDGACTQCKINSIQNSKGECECMDGFERYDSDENCMEICPENTFYNPIDKQCTECFYYKDTVCLSQCPESEPEIVKQGGKNICQKVESINRMLIIGVLLFGVLLVLTFLYVGCQNCFIKDQYKLLQQQAKMQNKQKIIPDNSNSDDKIDQIMKQQNKENNNNNYNKYDDNNQNSYQKVTLPNDIKIARKLTLPTGTRRISNNLKFERRKKFQNANNNDE